MNFIKKFAVGLLTISILLVTTYATDNTTTIATATITSLTQGAIHLQQLEVINNAATAVSVYFYDAPTNVLTQVVGAFTNWLTYNTNIVITTTNYQGVVETATNLATYTIPRAVSQATNSYRLFKTITVAAGGDTTWTPVTGVYLSYGLAATNNNTNTTINWTSSTLH